MKRICVILVVAFLFGCVPAWKKADGLYQSEQMGFTANFPAGWVKEVSKETVYIKKERIPLSGMIIEKIKFTEPTVEKARFKKGMMPHEIVEVVIDEVKAYRGASNVKVIETSIATIANSPGSKTVFTYRKSSRLVMKAIVYVVQTGEHGFKLTLFAPSRHYFDMYVGDFEKMVASFQLTKS